MRVISCYQAAVLQSLMYEENRDTVPIRETEMQKLSDVAASMPEYEKLTNIEYRIFFETAYSSAD